MLVTTTKGEMDDSLLEKREGELDNENERTDWTEFWLDGECIHRSVHIRLKKAVVFAETAVEGFGK